jgi:hypothetical protein
MSLKTVTKSYMTIRELADAAGCLDGDAANLLI